MESLGGFAPSVIYFFIYSFIGYLVEVVYCSIAERKLVNRGFLFGPVLPIYGTGMLLILVSTKGVTDNLALTFLVSMGVCSVTEYLISWAMEKIFRIKWWDYSEVYKLHINGRICLVNSVLFGVAGLLVVNWVQPTIAEFVVRIPRQEIVAGALLVLVALDTIASTYAVKQVEHSKELEKISGDQTNEIKKLARAAIKQLLTGKQFLERKVDETKQKVVETTQKTTQKVIETKDSVKEAVKIQQDKVKQKLDELKR